ncbi:MAG: zinc-dependent peptidase [Syntrophaceae bacterium]|jgi:MtfA peptidase|nr:zinc-dependent peptidase [Syntrophaceae bacterium]HOC60462.1 zinc-dependent peptidase [Smithellaceae bacterium]HQM45913.1 zinc-dependent peptidase [Smithellaceae bacterium]
MFTWFSKQKRKKLTQAPFPRTWEGILDRNMAVYRRLNDQERLHLRGLVQIFMAEKHWEGCGGMTLTDEIKVTIAAHACLLILNIPGSFYDNVETILVYPSDVILPEQRIGFFENVLEPVDYGYPISGQAIQQGPVLLVWDRVSEDIHQDGTGFNVVYHEFAHKLDMEDGTADGTPRLRDRAEYRDWVQTCTREYLRLLKDIEKGKRSFLDEYGATDEAEFFAVATEQFFDRPRHLFASAPELYRVLKNFYRQDPVKREKIFFSRND